MLFDTPGTGVLGETGLSDSGHMAGIRGAGGGPWRGRERKKCLAAKSLQAGQSRTIRQTDAATGQFHPAAPLKLLKLSRADLAGGAQFDKEFLMRGRDHAIVICKRNQLIREAHIQLSEIRLRGSSGTACSWAIFPALRWSFLWALDRGAACHDALLFRWLKTRHPGEMFDLSGCVNYCHALPMGGNSSGAIRSSN